MFLYHCYWKNNTVEWFIKEAVPSFRCYNEKRIGHLGVDPKPSTPRY